MFGILCHRILLLMIKTAKDIEQLGSIMGVWAHPDDEAWSSAGIMATARANEQNVVVLSATKGDAGQTADEATWAQKQLRSIRELEFKHALEAVNVEHGILLDYDDGKLTEADDASAIEEIGQHISMFQPDTILTFEEHGITGHGDHRTISDWARKAAAKSNKSINVYGCVETEEMYHAFGKKADELFNIYFAIDEPVLYKQSEVDICFSLPKQAQDKKRSALLAHASQTSGLLKHSYGKELLEASLQKECFIKLD